MTMKSLAQHGLEKQYARLVGELDGLRDLLANAQEAAASLPSLEARRDELEESIAALARSIKLFDANWSDLGVKSTKPNKRRNPLPYNTPSRHAMAMLHRDPNGFTTGEIMEDLCRAHNLVSISDSVRESFRAAIDTSMRRKARDGYVVGVGMRPRRWKLAPRPAAKQAASNGASSA